MMHGTQRHINTLQYDARYTKRHINTLQYDARYTQRQIPQNDICPHGRTYRMNAVAMFTNRIATLYGSYV